MTPVLFKDDQICQVGKDSSTSNRSKLDQETGSSDTLERDQSEVVVVKGLSFLCFPLKMDKALIRIVRI